MAKQELLATIRDRYQESFRQDKCGTVDVFTLVTGNHRKHGIRQLGRFGARGEYGPAVKGRRICDEAVLETVIMVWEAGDRICGKLLKAAPPNLVEADR